MRKNYVVFGSTSGRGISCFLGPGHRPKMYVTWVRAGFLKVGAMAP